MMNKEANDDNIRAFSFPSLFHQAQGGPEGRRFSFKDSNFLKKLVPACCVYDARTIT
jgi:hypothetical protein